MGPITGYYAFIAAALMFALLGANRRLSVGADSTVAPLIAAGLAPLAVAGSHRYLELAALLAVLVGVILGVVWALRLGWVAEFLSIPIITGFLAGVAVVIAVHQLPDLLGLAAVSGSNWHRFWATVTHVGASHVWTLAVGLGVLVTAVAANRVSQRVPGPLIALVGATLLVSIVKLRSHGVAVIGRVAHAGPRLGLSGLSVTTVGHLAPIAAIIALVVVSQTAATTRAFGGGSGSGPGTGTGTGEQDQSEADIGRDLLGVGAANLLAGVIGAFPVNASPPRSAAAAQAGAHSQLANLVAAAALAALIPASGLLSDIPLAALAGILLFIAGRIFDIGALGAIARFDGFEFGLAALTLTTVAVLGVEQGIGVSVALAILDRTRRSNRPHLHTLGRIPGTTSWVPTHSSENTQPLPGTVVVLFATPLWYANATHFRTQLTATIAATTPAPSLVVLDAIGMSDIDYTGAQSLGRALNDLEQAHITFAVARAGSTLRSGLRHAGLLARIGSECLFDSVDEAVTALAGQRQAAPERHTGKLPMNAGPSDP